MRWIRDRVYRSLDSDVAWWGLRRFRPARDRPYTSKLLLLVCLVYGLPLAGMAWAFGLGAATLFHRLNPLVDDRDWLPQALAGGLFVYNGLANGLGCWLWNRRAFQLDPSAFGRGARAGRLDPRDAG